MTKYYYDPNMNRGYIPGKYVNKVVFLIITFFLGHIGIQYFYIEKKFKGIMCLFFLLDFYTINNSFLYVYNNIIQTSK